MAERPIFIPRRDKVGVIVKPVNFTWFAGFAPSQKKKSIASLHEAAEQQNIAPLLEISSKGTELGQQFSAFKLLYCRDEESGKAYPIENIFQGSKVFANGGPYTDLYDKKPREAKKDERLKDSGNLVGFNCFGEEFPLEPKTYFYDFIYINALLQDRDFSDQLLQFNGFTDIEFNPEKSINCQAYSAALYVSLAENNLLEDVRNDKAAFLDIISGQEARPAQEVKAVLVSVKPAPKVKKPKKPKKLKGNNKAEAKPIQPEFSFSEKEQ